MAAPGTTSTSGITGSLRTNYARIGHAVQQVFPQLLQEVLVTKEPQKKLHSDISSNKYLQRMLRADEWSMINNARNCGYTNFDIPLSYKLIRNLKLVPPPSKGWDFSNDPTPAETTPGDDVERIRRKRNEIIHRGNAYVSSQELKEYFDSFRDVARRLEIYLGKPKDEFVNTFNELENCSMDENTEKLYLDKLEELRKMEEDLKSAIVKLREDVNSLMNEENGANVNLDNVQLNETPITAACAYRDDKQCQDRYNIVELLLDKGALVNTVDHCGDSPLTNACRRVDINLVRFLLSKGADVNLHNVH